ncbi:MAG TPA: FAD-binding protein, partial [Gemmatimonadales bacterium]|nr:FAD-binding protein [Gemmatimonadales bacterium]
MTPASDPRIIPGDPPPDDGEAISPDVWGFRDSGFAVLPNGSVTMTGARYPLSGAELPDLLPWIKQVMAIDFPLDDVHDSGFPPQVPEPRENLGFLREVRDLLPEDAATQHPLIRLRHGHGHTLEEMYAIKYGRLERVPDLVVFPRSEEQVAALVEVAARHDVCLVPYGGGTNVTDALKCPADEDRMIVSVDLKSLNRIRWIDPVNLMA